MTIRHKQAIRNLAQVSGFELAATGRVISPVFPQQSKSEGSEINATNRYAA